jgi:GntR family transcriptional regulator/MocR family aminotransferase
MSLLKELIIINKKSEIPVYLQIANAFVKHIQQGRFRKGLRLPGSREIASVLDVNRTTIVAALTELEAQGWIELLPRKGTFVRLTLPLFSPKKITEATGSFTIPQKPGFRYDEKRIVPVSASDFLTTGKLIFNDGFPDVRITPIEQLTKTMRRLSRLPSQKKYLQYGGAQGTLFLRETLCTFLNETRGLPITPENILITRGAQMGLFIAASIIIKPGDYAVVGTPGYDAATTTFRQVGARIQEVSVDEDGMNIDLLEALCKKKKIKAVFVIPHHHNPTTVTLIPERRIRLLELAAKYKFAIIEDDYDYDFHYTSKPIMPMASIDGNGHVIYIGTFTKTIAPSVRFGFIVAPASFIRTSVSLRKTIDTQGDSLMENAIGELYKDGTIARHIKKSVSLYKERRDNLCSLLTTHLGDQVSFAVPDGGMSVWAKFLHADLTIVSELALKKGLILRNGRGYDTDKVKYNSVRLGFASLNFAEQEKAVKILKEIIK